VLLTEVDGQDAVVLGADLRAAVDGVDGEECR
jgi:hypothetical protein